MKTITEQVLEYQRMSLNYKNLENSVEEYKKFKKKILSCFTNEEIKTESKRRKIIRMDFVKNKLIENETFK